MYLYIRVYQDIGRRNCPVSSVSVYQGIPRYREEELSCLCVSVYQGIPRYREEELSCMYPVYLNIRVYLDIGKRNCPVSSVSEYQGITGYREEELSCF